MIGLSNRNISVGLSILEKGPASMEPSIAVPINWTRGVIVWLLLMLAEVINGSIRTLWIAPVAGDFRARQIGVFSGSIIILAIACLTILWIGTGRRRGDLLVVGAVWLVLTLLFETGLGRFVLHYSWEKIGADYNVTAGGLLPLGLLVLTLAPSIAARIRKIGR
jgi:hypothetical protein